MIAKSMKMILYLGPF